MLLRRLRNAKIIAVALVVLTLLLVIIAFRDDLREIPDRWHIGIFNPEPRSRLKSPKEIFLDSDRADDPQHPIDELRTTSSSELASLLEKRSYNVSAAAASYHEKRGRHPPPGFDDWVDFALNKGCLLIEDFFDQIYRDLEPFWGLKAATIREAAATLPNKIQVRNGKATKSSKEWPFVNAYFDLIRVIERQLPDVDLPINEMDEPRVLLAWKDVHQLLSQIRETGSTRLPQVDHYGNLSSDTVLDSAYPWIHEGPFWHLVQKGCHPDSLARSASQDADFSSLPEFPTTWPHSSYRGFVSNWSIATDPCIHADLRNLHGTFVEPISQAISTDLIPIFSGSKLAVNNDILLPGAVYWNDDKRFSTKKQRITWDQKRDEVLWRGSASGGRNTAHNWIRFQRHRHLSMLNGTQIEMALEAINHDSQGINSFGVMDSPKSASRKLPGNFALPNQTLYPLRSSARSLLPDWIRSISNAAFTWLVCFPATQDYACSYTGSWYRKGVEVPLHRMFKAKYLPDVDGNSFSGRFLAFLRSNSLPIKATIYKEWHDDRLIPWRHFIPMDNTFVDLWAILEYLIANDDVAREIASEGQQWADKVLRKEDMLVYVYRLILEYARVSDDQRDQMAWKGAV